MTPKRILLALLVFPLILAAAAAQTETAQSLASTSPRTLVVTNWGDDTVSLVNIDDGHEMAVIDVGQKPYDVKIHPNRRFAYVTNSGLSSISVIDLQAGLEDSRIDVGRAPRDIAVSEDGSRAVVANAGDNSISVVDLGLAREVYRVDVGAIPYGVALLRDDTVALVSNWGENTLSVVTLEATAGEVTDVIEVNSLPYTVVTVPGRPIALVTSFGSNCVDVIDLDTMTLRRTIGVGRSPWGMAVAAVEGAPRVAVANFYSGTVTILESIGEDGRRSTRSLALVSDPPSQSPQGGLAPRTFELPSADGRTARGAKNAAFTPSGDLLVVTDLATNEILVTNPDSGDTIRTISVGKAPYGLAFFGGRQTK